MQSIMPLIHQLKSKSSVFAWTDGVHYPVSMIGRIQPWMGHVGAAQSHGTCPLFHNLDDPNLAKWMASCAPT
jgi:hypothetical protein